MLGLVGVQSNQFPRALDIARPFLKAGVPVCMGGFHVAGSLAMLDETPPEIAAAAEMGISFFIGEAEDGRLDEVLLDAYAGKLKPMYDYRDQMPNLQDSPIPFLPREQVDRTYGSFWQLRPRPRLPVPVLLLHDHQRAGAGEPLPLGRRSGEDRARQPRDRRQPLLPDRRQSRPQPQLGSLLRPADRAEARRRGSRVCLQVQVDTLCHRIPGFIEKGVKAGIDKVFVGMENINPDNLAAVKKNAEPHLEYREMFLAVEEASGRHHRRLHHRLPERHARVDPARHRGDQARAADRPDLFHQSDAAAGLRGPPAHAPRRAPGWIRTSTNTT